MDRELAWYLTRARVGCGVTLKLYESGIVRLVLCGDSEWGVANRLCLTSFPTSHPGSAVGAARYRLGGGSGSREIATDPHENLDNFLTLSVITNPSETPPGHPTHVTSASAFGGHV